jgi:hypothetical protein
MCHLGDVIPITSLFFVNFSRRMNDTFITIKAILDSENNWILDILAAPFGRKDSDEQTFDDGTDFMLEQFPAPAIFYHHGVMPGRGGLQKKPIIIGKAISVESKLDGIHVRVLLDKTLEWARRVWDAAKRGLAVASSDSIAHLARLDIGGKVSMYEKNKAGRIAVWPLAGLSLWDKVDGNFQPASRYAIAMPVMKAMYRETGLPFPDVVPADTNGVSRYAQDGTAKRARIADTKTLKEQSKKLIAYFTQREKLK